MALQQVLRQEHKYLLNPAQKLHYESEFSRILKADMHNGTQGYRVRSLYFDTLSDRDLSEKFAGVELRRKIRLRVYPPDTSFALLEMKQKQGLNQLKRSLKVSREHAEILLRGDYSPLLTYPEEFAMECYGVMQMHCYRPKVIVDYWRQAFVLQENSTRITLDSHLSASEMCGRLFDENPGLYPALHPGATVMEVKYNHFLLTYVKNLLRECNKSETAVSKYTLCRRRNVCF